MHQPWAGTPPPYPLTMVEHLDHKGPFDYGADYLIYNGLYRHTHPQTYDAHTHLSLPAEAFQRFVWHMDFQHPYKQMLKAYWKTGLQTYRDAAKVNFIAACNKQVSEASLSDAGRVLAWQVAGLQAPPTWASLGRKERHIPVVQVAALNIYGYVASNLLCLKNNASGLTLLYIPGNSSPLHEFASESAMKLWIARQCQTSHTRQALEQHFAPGDEADTLGFSGLSTALTGLGLYPAYHHFDPTHHPGFATSGLWVPQDIVNYKAASYSPPIDGDVFMAMARRQKKRTDQDADFIINSDSTITREKWRGYFNSAINTLGPIAMVVPELAPLFAIGGVIEFGTGLDRMLHGKTLQERAGGFEDQVWGLLNALPLLHLAVPEKPALFRFKSTGFVSPSRVNGQLGYPMSPMQPPHLAPVEPVLEEAFTLADSVAPVIDADPALAQAVVRVPNYKGERDLLQAQVNGYNANLYYDIEADAFVSSESLNEIDPPYLVAPEPGQRNMLRLNAAERSVSDAQRMRTLRALGVELELPVNFDGMLAPQVTPIPKRISCIWVGDQVIKPELLENLGRNAQLLKRSQYSYRLFLSNASPEAYARNVELLGTHAPTLEIIPLEPHPLYKEFENSPYFAQYQAAIDGNGGVATNYSSASDVLRYRLLKHQGGIYMDVDDSLLGPDQITAMGSNAEPIDEVALHTSDDGLILSIPVSNEMLGMTIRYNGSMIGSHVGNPTLDVISDLMRQRFEARPDFYNSRPSIHEDPLGFMAYAGQLNHMTGPGVLNDAIETALPALKQFREVWNFGALPVLNAQTVVDDQLFRTVYRQLTPLSRFAKIGSTLSWAHT
ncbi:dermonecrotic toxin domain-containing protein [Pseudomonas brassicae]|uniref:dermonecrotic toxin domain-containing protein n=1 Tax=Pseudomonas brassicae TaxID=2708063 RepID=UPI001FB3DFB8|nr:DUF6543 domain-containing protein [Pseudomonas brassicae]